MSVLDYPESLQSSVLGMLISTAEKRKNKETGTVYTGSAVVPS